MKNDFFNRVKAQKNVFFCKFYQKTKKMMKNEFFKNRVKALKNEKLFL